MTTIALTLLSQARADKMSFSDWKPLLSTTVDPHKLEAILDSTLTLPGITDVSGLHILKMSAAGADYRGLGLQSEDADIHQYIEIEGLYDGKQRNLKCYLNTYLKTGVHSIDGCLVANGLKWSPLSNDGDGFRPAAIAAKYSPGQLARFLPEGGHAPDGSAPH